MLLRENYEGIFEFDETKKDKDILGTTTVPFIETDVKNLNGRRYPTRVMKNEIARLKGRLADQKYLWGAPSHPEGGAHEIKIGDISHRISDIFFDEKTKRAVAKIDILNTRAGKDLAVIIKHGKLYVSARGSGTTKPGADEAEEVDDSYRLHGIDFTLTPSFDFGGVSGLQENLFESVEIPTDEVEDELEKELQETEEEEDLDEEFSSLRSALEDIMRAEFDPDAWVKDFSATEVVVQRTERDPVTGATADILLRMPYKIDPDTDEITIDFDSVEIVKQVVDYVPEQMDEAKFGLLSEQEMRMSGAKKQFGKSKKVELSAEEAKYISPRLAQILRDEKFPKK